VALLAFWHLLTGGAAHGIPDTPLIHHSTPFPPEKRATTAKTTRHGPSHASLTKIGLQLELEVNFSGWRRRLDCSLVSLCLLFSFWPESWAIKAICIALRNAANRKYNSLIESLAEKMPKTNGETNAVSTNELKRQVVPLVSRLKQLSHIGCSAFEVS